MEEQDLPLKRLHKSPMVFCLSFKTSLMNLGSIKRGNKLLHKNVTIVLEIYISVPALQGM